MKLTILATSDTHGYLEPTNYVKQDENMPFGLEKAASVIKNETKKAENTLIVDNGDFLEGSPLAYYEAEVQKKSQPNAINNAFNTVDYDFGSLGNHEFNYGQEYLKQSIKSSNREILCANILQQDGTPAFGKAYDIKQIGDVKVGVLGLTTQAVNQWENKDDIAGLKFKSAFETAKKLVPEIRKQADVVVVIYHGGFERDKQGRLTEKFAGENESYHMLQGIEGIDALVTGHQHRKLANHLFGVPYVQPGHRGNYVGKITLDLEKKHGAYKVTDSDAKLIPVEVTTPTNLQTKEAVSPTESDVEKWLATPLAKIKGEMSYQDPFEVRKHGAAFINLIQKIQMETMGVDISATALFSNESRGFENPITMRNIITNYVYPNTLAVLKITGADLKAALEKSAEYFVIEDNKIAVNPDYYYPKMRDYNYDMYAGISYTIKVSDPVGHRIQNLTYHGKPIPDDEQLKIVLNGYRAVGGGHYDMFDESKIVSYNTITMSNLIADYLRNHPHLVADTHENFQVIK